MLTLNLQSQDAPAETPLLSSFMKIPTASSRTSQTDYFKGATMKQISINIKALNLTLLLLSPSLSLCVYFLNPSVIALVLALFLSICQAVVAVCGFRLESEVTAATLRFYRRSAKAFLMLIVVFLVFMQVLYLVNRWKVHSTDCTLSNLYEVCKERSGVLGLDLLLYVLLPTADVLLYVVCAHSCTLVSKYTRRLKQNIDKDTWW